MSYPVTYYCPRCGTFVEVQRDGYLADKAVTSYPFEGWSYAAPAESFEEAEGVRFVCGESEAPGLNWRAEPETARRTGETGDEDEADDSPDSDEESVGCGEPFYLSFVRFEDGREVDPRTPSKQVRLADDATPRGPQTPEGPGGPGSL